MNKFLAIAALAASLVSAASDVASLNFTGVAGTRTRVNLHPVQIKKGDNPENDAVWVIEEATSATFSVKDIEMTLSAPKSITLNGDWNKLIYAKFLATMGERLVGTGISTDEDKGGPITLTVTGLSNGNHSLLTWHNSWKNADENLATVSVSVNGKGAVSDVKQSGRVDNMWEAATSLVEFSVSDGEAVDFVFTPKGGDSHVYLNGFEFDAPTMASQVAFPYPENHNEHVEIGKGGSIQASWRAPSTGSGVKYNVYLGTAADKLSSIGEGLTEPSVELADLNAKDTFYWRVDVVANGDVHIGQTWTFRVAQLAFPGAEGWGRYARGGRGGKVVKVTTLEDSEEPGTLRHALTIATGPRVVVFDVGGVITTKSRISVNGKYVTLAGQTAPGKGIAIQGNPLGLTGASDIVFRHIRVRPGTVSRNTVDGMGMQGSNHAIFDRCSMGWTMDEAFSSRSAFNISFQRSVISEPLNVAGHKNYPEGTAHGYAATVGGDVGSFHHNLLAHAEGRSWSMGGGVDNNANFAGKLDIRNNVVYNFGSRVTDGGAHQVNFVGNYYKPGPASSLTYALRAQYEDGLPGTQTYHCAGNSMEGHFDQDSTQYPPGDGTSTQKNIACWADVSIDPAPEYQKFYENEFFEPFVDTQSSTDAYKRVLSDSGASQPILDDQDKRIIQETIAGSYNYTGSVSGKKGLIDNPKDVGGLEDFPEVHRESTWDADDDGVADWWDGSTGGEDYTVIEGYLNFMADPHAFVEPSGSVEINLGALATGFVKPTFKVTGAAMGTVTVEGSTAVYKASKAGVDRLEVEISDDEGSKWTRSFGVAVFKGAGTGS
ncbi:hypothetical protein FZEAL_5661 [Fusarium zealandicum]|uniref:Pectate lyase n=1 Tax=Fusarium zealandicum TaxID=1053134 RepID=A0A8H4XJK9_9HYPO|nr:hypothetical protein FZEAL_5661 [Fusarium zealandicum]